MKYDKIHCYKTFNFCLDDIFRSTDYFWYRSDRCNLLYIQSKFAHFHCEKITLLEISLNKTFSLFPFPFLSSTIPLTTRPKQSNSDKIKYLNRWIITRLNTYKAFKSQTEMMLWLFAIIKLTNSTKMKKCS